jgi:hypothetical protein
VGPPDVEIREQRRDRLADHRATVVGMDRERPWLHGTSRCDHRADPVLDRNRETVLGLEHDVPWAVAAEVPAARPTGGSRWVVAHGLIWARAIVSVMVIVEFLPRPGGKIDQRACPAQPDRQGRSSSAMSVSASRADVPSREVPQHVLRRRAAARSTAPAQRDTRPHLQAREVSAEDELVAALATGAAVHRGPTFDVLTRCWNPAGTYGPTIVVRRRRQITHSLIRRS